MMSPTGSRSLRPPPAGMTFIELIMVVIIISIFAVGPLVNFRKNFNTFQLNNAASILQAFMNYLHDRAIVDGKVILLSIDNDRKEYWAQVKGAEGRLRSYTIPKELTVVITRQVESPDGFISFYPDGQIDKVTVRIETDATHSVSLTTEGVFGRVKLKPQE